MSEAIRNIMDEEIQTAFSMFDHEGTDTIDLSDFGTLMRIFGFDMNEEDAHLTAEVLDKKQQGAIQFVDFRDFLFKKINSKDIKDQFKKAFEAMDIDNDKMISFGDLKNFLDLAGEKRTEDEIMEMISDADIDGDGLISFEEFMRIMVIR